MALKSVKFKSSIISLQALAKLSGVNYYTVYRRRFGIYKKDMKLTQRTKLANAIMKDIGPFINDLGFEISIKPLKDSPQG